MTYFARKLVLTVSLWSLAICALYTQATKPVTVVDHYGNNDFQKEETWTEHSEGPTRAATLSRLSSSLGAQSPAQNKYQRSRRSTPIFSAKTTRAMSSGHASATKGQTFSDSSSLGQSQSWEVGTVEDWLTNAGFKLDGQTDDPEDGSVWVGALYCVRIEPVSGTLAAYAIYPVGDLERVRTIWADAQYQRQIDCQGEY